MEIRTFGMHLKALILDLESKFFGDCFAIPFHKRGVYILNVVAVRANDLRFEAFGLSDESVKFVVLPNIDLADDSTFYKEGKAAVQGGPGYGLVQILSIAKQLLGREVTGLSKKRFDHSFSLPGHTQAFA
jgi:hypothetical protein